MGDTPATLLATLWSHVSIARHSLSTPGWHVAGRTELRSSLEAGFQRTPRAELRSWSFTLQAERSERQDPICALTHRQRWNMKTGRAETEDRKINHGRENLGGVKDLPHGKEKRENAEGKWEGGLNRVSHCWIVGTSGRGEEKSHG